MRNPITECLLLASRNLRIYCGNRLFLTIILIQVPIITLLIALSFHDFSNDHSSADKLARTVYFFQKYKSPYEAKNISIPLYSEVIPRTMESADNDNELISIPSANSRAAVYFILVSSAVWIGVLGSCKEIVSEHHVAYRELRTCTRILPYLLSKFVLHALVLLPQTAFMTFVIGIGVLELVFSACLMLWIVLWIVSLASTSLGFLVSSISPSIQFALMLVPILMIPQFMLGGLLRPPIKQNEGHIIRQHLSDLTIQRWGFEAALYADPYAWSDVVSVEPGSTDFSRRYGEMNLLQSRFMGFAELFFSDDHGSGRGDGNPLLKLTVITSALMLSCWGALHKRYGV